jgi:hypothetical protein
MLDIRISSTGGTLPRDRATSSETSPPPAERRTASGERRIDRFDRPSSTAPFTTRQSEKFRVPDDARRSRPPVEERFDPETPVVANVTNATRMMPIPESLKRLALRTPWQPIDVASIVLPKAPAPRPASELDEEDVVVSFEEVPEDVAAPDAPSPAPLPAIEDAALASFERASHEVEAIVIPAPAPLPSIDSPPEDEPLLEGATASDEPEEAPAASQPEARSTLRVAHRPLTKRRELASALALFVILLAASGLALRLVVVVLFS